MKTTKRKLTRREKRIQKTLSKLFSHMSINITHNNKDLQMKKNRFEIRTAGPLTADQESRKIGGLAIAVESKSELLGGDFYETIKRAAVDEALIKSNDIKLYLNHDSSQGTIARSKFGKGSLRLFVTDRGLEFETELPNTEKGNEVIEGIRRGDIDACSFAMIPDSVTWSELGNNLYQRDINSFKMVDEISILSCLPAYSATEVDMRSLEDFKSYEETRAADESKEKIKAPDDDMEEPITKVYNKRSQDEEDLKEEEKAAEDEQQEETKSEEVDKEEEETKSEEDNKPEDEETSARDANSEEEDKTEEEEEKDKQEEKEEDEEEDRMLTEYYTSLRALIK